MKILIKSKTKLYQILKKKFFTIYFSIFFIQDFDFFIFDLFIIIIIISSYQIINY